MKYESLNIFFEKEFIKAIKESIFDYSIISLAILDSKNFNKYEEAKKECPNCMKKLLFHGSQIGPISEIMSSEFKYTKKAFYGMGIYFSDILDYISFYCGGDNYKNRRKNFNKILSPNSTFSLIAAEIFYDKELLRHIRDASLYVPELKDFPTYEEIKQKYPDKMVPRNGINFITVKSDHGQVIENSVMSKEEREQGNFIGNEYVITELEQICPIYSLTLKRNEYFILWRDLNFEGKNIYTKYLKSRELFANEIAKMNIYLENRTEDALRFIHKRRYNKMILITSIGLDLSGKKFIEIARKILGSNIIVLIFSNNKEHLKWIQKYPNVLYTNDGTFYEDYIKNYNEKDLKDLKKRVEKQHNTKPLEFSNDFMSYPLYLNNDYYSNINISEKSKYIKRIIICYKPKNMFLIMNENGTFKLVKEKNESYSWDITLNDDELTLFSNGYYLGINKISKNSNEIITDKYMKYWDYKIEDNYYLIKPKNNNNILLSVNEYNTLCFSKHKSNSIFEFIDV